MQRFAVVVGLVAVLSAFGTLFVAEDESGSSAEVAVGDTQDIVISPGNVYEFLVRKEQRVNEGPFLFPTDQMYRLFDTPEVPLERRVR